MFIHVVIAPWWMASEVTDWDAI